MTTSCAYRKTPPVRDGAKGAHWGDDEESYMAVIRSATTYAHIRSARRSSTKGPGSFPYFAR